MNINLFHAHAGPSGTEPATPATTDLTLETASQLLKRCFDSDTIKTNGLIKNAVFTVRGSDGLRRIEIEFIVNGNGIMCELKWKLNQQGSVQSHFVANGEWLQPGNRGSLPTGITLKIFGRADPDVPFHVLEPYIYVEDLFPNIMMNGKFVRSIVFQLQSAYTHIFQVPMHTRLSEDSSSIREAYWLRKGRGQTYFENVWKLEYECILKMPAEQREAFLQISRDAYDLPANTAFDIQGYEHMQGLEFDSDPDDVHIFDETFIQQIETYKTAKGPAFDYSAVTIRDCLNEFLEHMQLNLDPFWYKLLHQNAFIFFFRGHPQFRDIARQVLHGYDRECSAMRGGPYDPEPKELLFSLQVAPIIERISAIEDADMSHIIFTLLFFISFIIFTFYRRLLHQREQKDYDLSLYRYSEL